MNATLKTVDVAAEVLLRKVQDSATDLRGLLAVWQLYQDKPDAWEKVSVPLKALAERLLGLGAIGTAQEVLAAGLKKHPKDLRLRQLQGLAWARVGDLGQAEVVLSALTREGYDDEETLGILGRILKQIGLAAKSPEERAHWLRRSFGAYQTAYIKHRGYWTGINAATLAVLLGDEAHVRLVRQVRVQCLEEIEQLRAQGGDRYWAVATLGEAALIVRDCAEAERRYGEAAEAAGVRFGHLRSTREQARLLLAHHELPPEWADQWLPIPRAVVFVGHMIDRPGRSAPRFPPELEGPVRDAIRAALAGTGARIGFSSAACGADILFQEVLADRGGECHVILPYPDKEFLADSVAFAPSGDWPERYAAVIERAVHVDTASPSKIAGGGIAYEYANLLLEGEARARAAELGTELVGLALWDGRPGDGPGGTDAALRRWQAVNLPTTVINLDSLRLGETWEQRLPTLPASAHGEADSREARIMAMLFADVQGYSHLSDTQIALFVEHFLGGVAALVRGHPATIVDRNTWGDALYMVFPEVRDAGLFALDLCEWMTGTDWKAKGLGDLRLRIALHAGPVFAVIDPIRGCRTYTGSHVSCCARLEPITQPGLVYATSGFDALVRCQGITEFTCRLVERKEWPKSYGSYPVHLVQRHR